jgi:hypothetical protein
VTRARSAAALLLALAGCGQLESVAVTVDGSALGAAAANVRTLHVKVTGAECWVGELTVTDQLSPGPARFLYRTEVPAGTLRLSVVGIDAARAAVGWGTATVDVSPGREAPVTIRLASDPGAPPVDGDACTATPDLSGVDGAPPGDLGQPDLTPFAMPDGSAPRCDGGFLFCDDFEADAGIDTVSWSVQTDPSASITVDSQQAARGRQSLRFHINSVGSSSYIQPGLRHAIGLPNPAYVRAFVAWQAFPADVQAGFIDVGQDYGAYATLGLNINQDQIEFRSGGLSPSVQVGGTPPAAWPSQWSCLEMEIYDGAIPDAGSDAGAGLVSAWLNDQPLPGLTGAAGPMTQPFDFVQLAVGLTLPAGRPAFDVWFDSVVLDSKRIGCSR